MNLLPGEKVLCQLKKADTTLTNFRVRRDTGMRMTSLVLEHVTACKVRKIDYPIFLLLAVLGVAAMFFVGARNGDSEIVAWLGAGSFLFLIVYILSRSQNIQISSPSGVIEVELKRISYDEAIQFIEEVEEAIRYRALEEVQRQHVEIY